MGRTALVLLPWLFAAALVATAVLVGMQVPSLVIGSGVDSFEGAERAYAKEALHRLRLDNVSGSGRAFLVSALRITDVEACPDDDLYPDHVKVSAKVEIYTIFGIYYATSEDDCGDELLVRKHPGDRG